jgi:hypothetical protein
MALTYAPFEVEAIRPPRPPIKEPDTTECNILVMLFVGSILLVGLMDVLRS